MSQFDYPTGAVISFAGGDLPYDWVECDGRSHDGTIARYEQLYALIGLTYGGTSVADFKVPDLRGRTTTGAGAAANGAWSGVTTITLTDAQTATPAHTHTVTDPGHTHTPHWNAHSHTFQSDFIGAGLEIKVTTTQTFPSFGIASPTTKATNAIATGVASPTGSGSAAVTLGNASVPPVAHSNTQPTLALTSIIKL
jgi:microcystin-dependent protein